MHMLTNRTQVKPGDWVLVMGAASGVGSAGIQIAKQLGAKVISRPNFNFGGAWLYIAGIQIHLIEQGSPAGRGEIDTRGNHMSFAVPDVDAAEERLKHLGITYKRKLIEDRGIHQIFFQDPDGHTIEVGKYGVIDR